MEISHHSYPPDCHKSFFTPILNTHFRVTMTTVGYGDLVPVTAGGKVVAAMASVCGIIVLAFPISMIIDKFAESTGEWYGDEFVMNMQHHRRNDPKFRSVRQKSKRYLF